MFEFKEEVIYPKDPSATPERVAQYKEYYKIKYDLCKQYNPKVIAEIGVRAGYSGWTFLQACPKAHYIGIDANNGTHGGQGGQDGSFSEWAWQILKDYDAELKFLDTQTVQKLKLDQQVDFFHVDGDHTVRGVQHDLDLAFNCLSPEGVILVDDITYIDEVRLGVSQWLKKMEGRVAFKFVESLRGEMLIWRK